MSGKKKCNRCKQIKNESEFYKDSGRRSGLCNKCKECDKIQRREYYFKNREKELLADREYYRRNREMILKRQIAIDDQRYYGGNKLKVLQRDNYTCQSCGYRELPQLSISGFKTKLLIHHKDGYKLNNFPENQIVCCRVCHPGLSKGETKYGVFTITILRKG